MTARTGDVIETVEELEALVRQYAEAGAPAVVQEHGFRLWILTEDERGDHWAWSWREGDDSERESEEGGTVVPVETLNLPLTVLHVPGEQKPLTREDATQRLARAAFAVDSAHHFHVPEGSDRPVCSCGFVGNARKRTQTEHITTAVLEEFDHD